MAKEIRNERDANRDPITGAPGSHPIGTGVGAAIGGAGAGAAAGAVAGPLGAAVGAAVGAVAGGLAGKAVAEVVDPTAEEAFWEENYDREPYYEAGRTYEDYQPAYRVGYEGRARYNDRRFEEVEPELESDYQRLKGRSSLAWPQSRNAARAAWDRIDRNRADERKVGPMP